MEENNKLKQKLSKRWLITIHNPEDTDEEMKLYLVSLSNLRFCVFQREKGNKEIGEHFQIFLILKEADSFESIKDLFPYAYVTRAIGCDYQNIAYCTKSDTRVSGPYSVSKVYKGSELNFTIFN